MPFDFMMPKGYIRMNVGTRNDLKTFDFFKTALLFYMYSYIYNTDFYFLFFAYECKYIF